MKLYHATFEHNLESIKTKGLQPVVSFRNDSISNDVICFADDAGVAVSFLETCDFAEEHDDYDRLMETIIVFEIDSSKLDQEYLTNDQNILQGSDDRYKQYSKPIPMELLTIVA